MVWDLCNAHAPKKGRWNATDVTNMAMTQLWHDKPWPVRQTEMKLPQWIQECAHPLTISMHPTTATTTTMWMTRRNNDSMCNGTNDKWRMTEQLAMMRDMRTDKVNSEGSKVCPAFLLFTSYFLSYYFTNHPPGAQPHNNNTTAATPLPQLPPPHPTWSSFKCTVLCAMVCLWFMFPFLWTHVFCCLYGNLP